MNKTLLRFIPAPPGSPYPPQPPPTTMRRVTRRSPSGEVAPESVTVGAVSLIAPTQIWDVYTRTIEVGGSRLLMSQSDAEWRLKSDVQHARIKWKSDDSPARYAPLDFKVDSGQLRVALEAKHPDYTMNDIPLEPSTQIGIRYYGGNSDGAEIEVDGLLRHQNTARGLTVEARAWALDGISEDSKDHKQWGVSATLRLTRANWQGLSLELTSGHGNNILDRNPNAWFFAYITYGLTPHPVWTTCPRLRTGY